ncbi:hypothetical protein OD350_29285 (plasmid) [Clostridium beijerinckii]|uniref:hypothetical protein n=1 Tax=Clostridium beijerinckii TaxID=1520 RepID=UPI00222749A2|nr:hypothetical protein [Clostridium beijerinckii]UYZ38983.1 hypothetical protein OD350_29285 [Clostridium beijerinckii]
MITKILYSLSNLKRMLPDIFKFSLDKVIPRLSFIYSNALGVYIIFTIATDGVNNYNISLLISFIVYIIFNHLIGKIYSLRTNSWLDRIKASILFAFFACSTILLLLLQIAANYNFINNLYLSYSNVLHLIIILTLIIISIYSFSEKLLYVYNSATGIKNFMSSALTIGLMIDVKLIYVSRIFLLFALIQLFFLLKVSFVKNYSVEQYTLDGFNILIRNRQYNTIDESIKRKKLSYNYKLKILKETLNKLTAPITLQAPINASLIGLQYFLSKRGNELYYQKIITPDSHYFLQAQLDAVILMNMSLAIFSAQIVFIILKSHFDINNLDNTNKVSLLSLGLLIIFQFTQGFSFMMISILAFIITLILLSFLNKPIKSYS